MEFNYYSDGFPETISVDGAGEKYSNMPVFLGFTKYIKCGVGGMGGIDGTYGSPGCFTGRSDSEKLAMCGITNDWSPSSAMSRGLIADIPIPCYPGSIKFNKYAANDLIAILNEINSLGWYQNYISSAYRTNLSAGGHSRHQVGLAVDLNAGGRGNPWFNYRIPQGSPEPPEGSSPPWPQKQCHYNGVYTRARCIWHWGHPVVRIFQAHGWGWGGSYGDVMHFSIDGH